MLAERTYTIGEVARILGLEGRNSSTVRLWTETFADWLSPLARPVRGQLRLYTEDDVRSLAYIRDLRKKHASYEDVRKGLAARNLALPEKDSAEAAVETAPAASSSGTVGADELRELLAPVFEVSEALRRFLKESDYSVGIHLELSRLAASVESLNAKLDLLRYDLETLRADLKTPLPPSPRTPPGGEGPRAARSFGQARASTDDDTASPGAVVPSAPVIAPAPAAISPTSDRDGRARGKETEHGYLNEYGLRPLPDWLVNQTLGLSCLCPRCGSTTKPLGVTPTARVVLACIQCKERLTLPLAHLARELGVRRGFWSRLWRLLFHR